MDQTTHDIRRTNWLEIIQQCQQRPANTTIKQWCLDQGISEKAYYYWLRKLRKEAAEQAGCPSRCFESIAGFLFHTRMPL